MKNRLLKSMLSVLIIVLVFATVLSVATRADAATSGYYTYKIKDGNAIILACNPSVSGDIVIPSELDGYPVTEIGVMAFYDCNGITGITIPEGVTTIGSGAFKELGNLQTVKMPNSLTSIGKEAFYNCGSLAEVKIPSKITKIEEFTFSGCYSLTSINIPKGVTNIGGYAFSSCGNLSEVIIPSTVTVINSGAFENCSSLVNMNIPKGVTHLGDGVFANCYGLKSVKLPEGLKSINAETFFCCTNLTSVNIPNSVTSIGYYAFANCETLTSITIPDNVTFIDEEAFLQCYRLSELTIGKKVTAIPWNAFYLCYSLTEVVIPDSVEIIDESAFRLCRRLSEISLGKNVTSIGMFAFDQCESLEEIKLPASVNYVGTYAFTGCNRLERVILCDKIETIEANAFTSITTDVAYPKDVATWTTDDFQNYGGHLTWKPYGQPVITQQPVHYYGNIGTTVTFSVATDIDTGWPIYKWEYSEDYGRTWKEYVADDAATNQISFKLTVDNVETMYRCHITDEISGKTALSSEVQSRMPVVSSGTVANHTWVLTKNGTLFIEGTGGLSMTDIEDKDWVKSVVILPGTTGIAGGFESYAGLMRIDIADTVTSISNVFNWCYELEDITLSAKLKSIDCSLSGAGMSHITIPKSVETIVDSFNYCYELKEVDLTCSIKTLNHDVFRLCKRIESLILGDSITAIEDNAFVDCFSLKEIVWPKNLKTIGNYAFYCDTATDIVHQMKELILPDSITSIGDFAFCGWVNLETVHLPNQLTSIPKALFHDCHVTKINIPKKLETVTSFFSNHTKTEVVTIPEGVSKIGPGAFDGYTGLQVLIFAGDPPLISTDTFSGVNADVAYSKDLGTWTEYDFVNYQGTLTWKPYGQPNVTAQPKHYTGKLGTNASFSVKTDIDIGWPEYQWQYSTDDGKTWKNYEAEDAKTAKLTVKVTAQNIGNMFRCVVTDGICKKTTNSEAAQIQTPVTITAQPKGICTDLGDAYSVSVTAAGAKLSYQWYVKNPADAKFVPVSSTVEAYSGTMDDAKNGQQLCCVITDAFGNSVTSDTVTAIAHTWNAATCETAKTCATCGKTEGKALGHKWNAATCETAKTCATCGKTEGKALGHKWNAATCETAKTCATCGKTEGKALGHKWNAATCEKAKTCATCGKTEGTAKGHSWDKGTVTKPATEKAEGVMTYKCTACGKTKTEVIPVLSHTHKYNKETVKPTCEAKGYDKYTCACGHSYTENGVAALGHKWNAATCEKAKTCATCGKTEGKALGHKWNAATCETAKTCATCGKTEGTAKGHSWDKGTVTKPATETTEGIMTYKCTGCGQTKTGTIPVLSHTHKYSKETVKATCEAKGYDKYTCSCGHSYTENETKGLGHKWNAATCETAKTCATCGKTEGGVSDHTYENGTCKVCGTVQILASGSCTVTITWTLDANGVLTVSGIGELVFVQPRTAGVQTCAANPAPWADYGDKITKVIVEDGITAIGEGVFRELPNLKESVISGSVHSVGQEAFADCDALKVIVFEGSAPEFGEDCFRNVTAAAVHPEENTSWVPSVLDGTGGTVNLATEIPETPAAKPGDVNGDGKADYSDALLILRASIGLETLTEEQKQVADVNGDGRYDYSDALKILRASIGLDTLL